jgi:hypothetical protein
MNLGEDPIAHGQHGVSKVVFEKKNNFYAGNHNFCSQTNISSQANNLKINLGDVWDGYCQISSGEVGRALKKVKILFNDDFLKKVNSLRGSLAKKILDKEDFMRCAERSFGDFGLSEFFEGKNDEKSGGKEILSLNEELLTFSRNFRAENQRVSQIKSKLEVNAFEVNNCFTNIGEELGNMENFYQKKDLDNRQLIEQLENSISLLKIEKDSLSGAFYNKIEQKDKKLQELTGKNLELVAQSIALESKLNTQATNPDPSPNNSPTDLDSERVANRTGFVSQFGKKFRRQHDGGAHIQGELQFDTENPDHYDPNPQTPHSHSQTDFTLHQISSSAFDLEKSNLRQEISILRDQIRLQKSQNSETNSDIQQKLSQRDSTISLNTQLISQLKHDSELLSTKIQTLTSKSLSLKSTITNHLTQSAQNQETIASLSLHNHSLQQTQASQ